MRHASAIRGTAVFALIGSTLAAGVFALYARADARTADAQHRIALSRQLAADAATGAVADPSLAQSLSLEAWAVSPTPEANAEMTGLLTSDARVGAITVAGGAGLVAYSPDGRDLATLTGNATLRLWGPATGALRSRATTVGPADDADVLTVFSPDGRTLADEDDGTVQEWDVANGKLVATVRTGLSDVSEMALSSAGTLAISGGFASTVQLWDLADGRRQAAGGRPRSPSGRSTRSVRSPRSHSARTATRLPWAPASAAVRYRSGTPSREHSGSR